MRILKLAFRNINSLKGNFDIDFQVSPLADSGLFVITGPTGAGKTSILDAVCVALYGQTPRLPNKKELEQLMTHHTGECRAEVTFSVNGKSYRSYYERYRARRKPGGKFQPPKMELVDVDEDKIIAEKISQVPLMVESLTGLDFARFSRSIMLAQGNFTAFLQAGEDERAVLLEKMTGTEIYTDISKSVFSRDKEEKQNLEKLNAILENFNLLSEEAIREKTEKLSAINGSVKEIDKALATLADEKKYLQNTEGFKTAIADGEEKLGKISDEIRKSMPDFEKLERSLKTLPLKEPYAVLRGFRNQAETLKKKIVDADKKIPGIKGKLEKTEQDKKLKSGEFETFKAEKEKIQGLITETVKRDSLIKNEKERLTGQIAAVTAVKKQLEEVEKTKKKTKSRIAIIEKEIKTGEKYLSDHNADKDLVKDLPLVFEKTTGLKEMTEKKTETQHGITQCRKELENAQKKHKKTKADLKQTESLLAEKNNQKEALSEKLTALLSGEDLAFWEEKGDVLKKQQQDIEKLQEKGRQVVELEDRLTSLKDQDQSLGKEHATAEEQQKELILKKEEKEREIVDLEKAKELEDAIKSLEERRRELVKDAPCPLCGSTDHPWAEQAPSTGISADRIKICKNELKDVQKRLQKVEKNITTLSTRQKLNTETMGEEEKNLTGLNAEYRELCKTASLYVPPDQWKSLNGNLESISKNLKQTTKVLKEIKKGNDDLAELSEQIVTETKRHSDNKVKCEKAEHQKSSLEEKESRLTQESQELDGRFEKEITDLNRIFEPYEEKITDAGETDKSVDRLKGRSDSFQKQSKRLEKIKGEIIPLREELAVIQTTIDNDLKQLELENNKLQQIEKNLHDLTEKRKALFGEKDPEKEQAFLKQKTLDFENTLKKLESTLTEIKNQLAAIQETRKQNRSDLENAEKEMLAASQNFNNRLEEAGFSHEQEFLAASLPEEDQKRLEHKKETLEKRKTENLSLIKDSQKKLEKALANPVTEESMEAVSAKAIEVENQKAEIIAEKGAIQSQLEENKKRIRDHRKKVEEAGLQAKECKRWSALNDLIGAADGAKFRKFAQGLTLETLMENANTYLDMLNRRYVLKRSESSDLTIEVIDTFYGDQVRPTDNLSGGESFLISLSLALGLSDLSSRRTNIESLFLDEGFGTLDPETLETALGALDTLNASGKTIGIISHVEALKERIPAKIEVRPVSGGVSELVVA